MQDDNYVQGRFQLLIRPEDYEDIQKSYLNSVCLILHPPKCFRYEPGDYALSVIATRRENAAVKSHFPTSEVENSRGYGRTRSSFTVYTAPRVEPIFCTNPALVSCDRS